MSEHLMNQGLAWRESEMLEAEEKRSIRADWKELLNYVKENGIYVTYTIAKNMLNAVKGNYSRRTA